MTTLTHQQDIDIAVLKNDIKTLFKEMDDNCLKLGEYEKRLQKNNDSLIALDTKMNLLAVITNAIALLLGAISLFLKK